MRLRALRRQAYWLLPLLAALLLGLLGARLISLSVRERAAQLRRSAESAVLAHARRIETELGALAALAAERARGEASAGPPATFSMSDEGVVLSAAPADAATASAVAAEWSAAPPARRSGVLFGPVRYGSQWLVVAHVAAAGGGWSVSFENLDALLSRARFGALVQEGYDFQLLQPDPLTHQPRVFLSSHPGVLAEPARSAIALPDAAPVAAAPYLTLAIRPRSGWYPARELAAEIGVLALLMWAAAFAVYDLTHSLERTRNTLAATRRRLKLANERLVGEIEQRESLQRSFEHARYHDGFTGLPNRRYFMDQLDRGLREIRTRRRRRIAIALIDIERLRLISDTLGHTAGDELLLQAAQRCVQVLGATEHVVARWGADQLAVLLYDLDSAAAAQELAERLREECNQPYELRQHRLRVSSRVGFTCTDSGLQRAEDAVREADLAVSLARQQQRTRAVAYAPGMAGAAVSLVSLEADLHVALERREFRLLFQPIVELRGGRVVGAEALLRWRHPVEGLLSPDKFLAIAEEVGVIVPVTRWIIQRVCRLAAEWRQRLPAREDFYISVNLSAAVLRSPGLREYVAEVLDTTRTAPSHLKFELSEGGLTGNVASARAVLDAFHDMGIELMLDDFGTGYSSLSYLQLFPFDYVKIDRPFVSRTGSERANNAITGAILQMASSLGLRAVAEVVETRAAAHTLLEMGCAFGQGYFFSPPVDAEAAFQQLRGSTRFAAGRAGEVPESAPSTSDTQVLDDSPTVMLPADMILDSRIHDDTDESEPASRAT
ncbi:MAG: bifunctional diguanylate cyclase/phosphodiesterase [Gammaproteobacteria bacterium]|nr:bifunctional diguanylate cyclase/phosphodiesterase [Gammaproteobacteria bacterium]